MAKETLRTPPTGTPPEQPASDAPRPNGTSSVRYASDEQFRKAQKKTSKAHAGLFRRLAK